MNRMKTKTLCHSRSQMKKESKEGAVINVAIQSNKVRTENWLLEFFFFFFWPGPVFSVRMRSL